MQRAEAELEFLVWAALAVCLYLFPTRKIGLRYALKSGVDFFELDARAKKHKLFWISTGYFVMVSLLAFAVYKFAGAYYFIGSITLFFPFYWMIAKTYSDVS